MKETIHLLQYNNYFNRRILVAGDTSNDYLSFIKHTQSNFNFDPKDGIYTNVILNTQYQGDYLLVCDNETGAIHSRWFVLEQEYVRDGQYNLSLRRDVIADNIDAVKEAPCFIEKATLDEDDPMLFNSENMTYNQIKQSETLLTDETEVPWIIGYISPNLGTDTMTFSDQLDSTGKVSGTKNVTFNEVKDITATITKTFALGNVRTDYFSKDEITYSISSGVLSYSLNDYFDMANADVAFTVTYPKGKKIEVKYKQSIPEAINASSLPWSFSTSTATFGTIDSIKVPTKIMDVTDESTAQKKYRILFTNTMLYLQDDGSYKITALSDTDDIDYISEMTATFDPKTLNRLYFTNVFDYDSLSYAAKLSANISLKRAIGQNSTVSSTLADTIKTSLSIDTSYTGTEDLTEYNNKVIRYNGNYYRISVSRVSSSTKTYKVKATDSYAVTQASNIASSYSNTFTGGLTAHSVASGLDDISMTITLSGYTITPSLITNTSTVSVDIPAEDNITKLNDAPYVMIAMPYGSINLDGITLVKETSLAIAYEMAKDLGTSSVYDVQLLPYCPIRGIINGYNKITVNNTGLVVNEDYAYIKDSSNVTKSIMFFCKESNLTFDINKEIVMPVVSESNALNKKISNECDMYRIVSPNYSGQFEFSVAKNGGTVSKFNVDLSYKPYNPYIHVNPNFNGLYGLDWNDSRGLICGGDFSLPIVSDAWTNYQVNNKNYQEIFDRQLQHMDVNNGIQMVNNAYSNAKRIGTGALNSGMSAMSLASGNSKAGMGLASNLWGLTTSITDAVVNTQNMTMSQKENLDLMTDNFGYSMGNIQAMPYSLTKSSALTYNNKLFPILEYYSCTQEEKEALKYKLKYDGMTVMKIGKINDLTTDGDTLVRGRLIRLNIVDDNHTANEIYNEISKGVYL